MDTMAIKYEEIPNMQNAIENYIQTVESELNAIKGYEITGADGVYGGDQIATVNNYVDRTAEEINKIVRHFDEFKENLVNVQQAYESKQASITTSEVDAAPADAGDLVTVNKME